jgi:TolB-like protein/Tfp pilus assembly protein PilF
MPAIIVILLGIIGYGAIVFLNQGKVQATVPANVNTSDRSIAVLPFADMSAANDQEYFSDGLSEELLNLLAKIPSLKVISRTSAFSFKGKNEDIRMIGEKLGVAYLLEGSVRKSGDKVRITAQLIKASDGSHLWSETFDRDMHDIFKVQDEIARAVVAKLKGQLLGSISTPLVSNPEAYNLYLESKFYHRKGTADALLKGIELSKKALRLDSTDVRIWVELSSCNIELWSNSSDREIDAKYYKEGYSAAEKALALAPDLPDAYSAMGFVHFIKSEFTEASKYYQKGLDLDPSNARSIASLAMVLTALGDFTKAEVLCRKSIELDPLNSGSYTRLSNVQLGIGDFDEAMKSLTKSVELGSDNLYMRIQHTICATLSGQHDFALQKLKSIDDPYWKNYCEIIVLWNMGKQDESRKLLGKFEIENKESGPFQIAELYAWRNEKEKALEWLDLAFKYEDPGLGDIKASPFLRSIRDDPRYKDVVKKMNMPI